MGDKKFRRRSRKFAVCRGSRVAATFPLSGPTCGTALLTVPVSEHRAFFGDAIDVRRAVAHDAVVVGTDIVPADVIAPDYKNIRFACLSHLDLLCLVR
jgi:hypothetical protein